MAFRRGVVRRGVFAWRSSVAFRSGVPVRRSSAAAHTVWHIIHTTCTHTAKTEYTCNLHTMYNTIYIQCTHNIHKPTVFKWTEQRINCDRKKKIENKCTSNLYNIYTIYTQYTYNIITIYTQYAHNIYIYIYTIYTNYMQYTYTYNIRTITT